MIEDKFEIEIEISLDEELDNKLSELYCDRCERWLWGPPGCCVGCTLKIDVEIKSEPSRLKEAKENVRNNKD